MELDKYDGKLSRGRKGGDEERDWYNEGDGIESYNSMRKIERN